MLSPIEGVVTAINPAVLADPSLATKDPYRDGWVCLIKSPEVGTDMRNLLSPRAGLASISNTDSGFVT